MLVLLVQALVSITSKANTDNFPAERARIILGSSIRNNEASEFSILLVDFGGFPLLLQFKSV